MNRTSMVSLLPIALFNMWSPLMILSMLRIVLKGWCISVNVLSETVLSFAMISSTSERFLITL